jgi:hypothetical protein
VKRVLEYTDLSDEPSHKKMRLDDKYHTPVKKSESKHSQYDEEEEESQIENNTNSSQNHLQTDSHS